MDDIADDGIYKQYFSQQGQHDDQQQQDQRGKPEAPGIAARQAAEPEAGGDTEKNDEQEQQDIR